jgi:iron complex outermembrane receptor protein
MQVSEVSDVAGGNLLNKYTHHYQDGSKLHAQIFFDKNQRYDTVAFNSVSTYDGTLQYDLPSFDSHDITFGVGYRYVQTSLRPFRILQSVDPDNSLHSVNSFIQDQISLTDVLKLTLGTKFDHPEYVGAQWQPTARLGWEVDKNTSIWTAFSRAARVPTLANNSIQISNPLQMPDGSYIPAQVLPNKSADSEYVNSYEAGVRSSVAKWMTVDMSLYFNKYTNLTNYVIPLSGLSASSNPNIPFVPIISADDAQVESYGVELSSNFQLYDNLSLKTWYTNLNVNTLQLGSSYPSDISGYEEASPRNQGYVRLEWDITDKYSLTPSLRFVDSVPEYSVRSYIAGGFKFAYRPQSDMEIAIGAENLFAPNHVEYQSDFILAPRTEIPTFGYVSLRVDF